MSTNKGGPAFPTSYPPNQLTSDGMSLRDWFAGQAMCGIFSACSIEIRQWPLSRTIAELAYEQADVMIALRNQKE